MRILLPISLLCGPLIACGQPEAPSPDSDSPTVPSVDTESTGTPPGETGSDEGGGCSEDGGSHPLGTVAAAFDGEAAGHEASFAIAGAGDTNGDGYDDLLIGSSFGPGAYVVLGGPDIASRSLSDADARLISEVLGDGAGFSVAAAGDVNGDGLADMLVGAIRAQAYGGAAYLIYGPVSGDVELSTSAARYTGEQGGDGASLVAGLGDVDGDNIPDVAVGAEYVDAGGIDAGAAYVVSGALQGDISLANASSRLLGEADGDEAGQVYGAGDTDGDGLGDLLVAAQNHGLGGVVYLVRAPMPVGDSSLADADARLLGVPGGLAGHDAAGLGDLDGDGLADVAVGAPYEDENRGAARIFTRLVSGDVDTATADVIILGENTADRGGFSVASGGDANGDGVRDVLVGAKFEDTGGDNAGAAYLLLGPLAGTISLADADLKLTGEAAGDLAGRVAPTGDVDGDGFDDILIGAKFQGDAGNDAGAAYLVLCPPL